ncbi:enoyl-CoA hydratase [uncultured Roseobacter sp.]|uniref:enoyl-CoA hydratase n=1 Tax=uncultured Roseobacter sp. TaxID=114847 RepID=UPI00261680FB|nr:enoyl-CoA hydratase [uncultured Roseobacter sp.]
MSDHELPVLLAVDAGVATVTINNPRAMNALSEDVLQALQETWDDLATNSDVKAVILRGAGNHFCAGHNLKEMTARRGDEDGGKAYFNDLFARCSKMMLSIVNLPQPVIVQVQGIATAAGCQLVATCDLAVAADDARFATSGVNIGLFCSTPMVALSRNIPRKLAMEMLLLGDFISASRAAEIGLINRVVPAAELDEVAMAMARQIVGKAPVAVRTGKRAFYEQAELPLEDAYAFAGRTMADNMMARDTRAGIDAFIAKEPMPEWQDD